MLVCFRLKLGGASYRPLQGYISNIYLSIHLCIRGSYINDFPSCRPCIRNMALKESLVLFGFFLLLCDGARLNVPRVLLPYRQEVATNYSLELIDASPGACYHWSSSQPDLVSVQPVNADPCALQALVSAVSHHPARRTAIVTADNS
ncbi:nuclear pore membrane glycoprotein 210, partial [Ixodes scapularis]